MQTAHRFFCSFSKNQFFKTASLPRSSNVDAPFAISSSNLAELRALSTALHHFSVGVDGSRLYTFTAQINPDGGYDVTISDAKCFALMAHDGHVKAEVTTRDYAIHLESDSVLMVSEGSGICGSDISYLGGSRKELLGDQGKVLGHEAVGRLVWRGKDANTALQQGQRVVLNPFIAPTDASLLKVPHLGPDQQYMGVPGRNGALTNGPIRVAASQLLPAPHGNNAFLTEPYGNGLYAVKKALEIEHKGPSTEHRGQWFTFRPQDPTPTVDQIKKMPRGSVLEFESCPTDLTADHFTEMQRGSMMLRFGRALTPTASSDSAALLTSSVSSDSTASTSGEKTMVILGDGIAGNVAAHAASIKGFNVVLIGRGSDKKSVADIVDESIVPGRGLIRRMTMESFLASHQLTKEMQDEDGGYSSPTSTTSSRPLTVIDCCGDTTALEHLLATGDVTTILGVARPKKFPDSFRAAVETAKPFLYKLLYRFDPTTFEASVDALNESDLSSLITGEFSLEETPNALLSLSGKNILDARKHVKVIITTDHAERPVVA